MHVYDHLSENTEKKTKQQKYNLTCYRLSLLDETIACTWSFNSQLYIQFDEERGHASIPRVLKN